MANVETVEQWGLYEIKLGGPSGGNPFVETELTAVFSSGEKEVRVFGFYDGDGIYRIRFMPEHPGEWTWLTQSNREEMSGKSGTFICTEATGDNHGPVQVHNTFHFAYADGTPYSCVGTTTYGWIHQEEALVEQTLKTLADAPFNKVRMMLHPKHFTFTTDEPELHLYEGGYPLKEGFDPTRFNPAFFQGLEKRIGQLLELGIEADLIFLTTYDYGRWDYDKQPTEDHVRLIRYVVARLAAYRNVWWSLANEYDLLKNKTVDDWEAMAAAVQGTDPYNHLLSIHNADVWYDLTRPWITHCSVQAPDIHGAAKVRDRFSKPVIFDEVQYEGTVGPVWGNLTAQEMVHRFWLGFLSGVYVGHSETYMHPDDIMWWNKGGVLHGESAPRIAFLRRILEEAPAGGIDPVDMSWDHLVSAGRAPDYYLQYFGNTQSSYRELVLPEGEEYTVDIIDTWNMTITRAPGTYRNKDAVDMPAKPWHAIRIIRAG